ncbi:MAG: DEAD/DEAH box helicase family protein, partial [Bacteroidota bacterium]|nr:DEAD/DEAH box helicase family protein [Bacteroidota bacterium]
MELKDYQQEVLDDLDVFLDCLKENTSPSKAFSEYWQSKGVKLPLQANRYLQAYKDNIKGVANVTLKVPTAGGKTFIACNAINNIFNHFVDLSPKVVTWFVASDTILKQTYKNLSDVNHPYRQKLNSLFNNRVCVVDKQAALMGNGISPIELQEQLTIFVLSIQSFATKKNKDGRKAFQENQFLSEHTKNFIGSETVNGADETSLINLLAHLNPVVIIDESHHFGSDIRVDVLNDIRPSFILDLTATPRQESNIISFVNAIKLKQNNMVKLPVIVYNKKNADDVIASAINFRNTLEKKAIDLEKQGGRYIRPIVLFQAESKGKEDNVTFEK